MGNLPQGNPKDKGTCTCRWLLHRLHYRVHPLCKGNPETAIAEITIVNRRARVRQLTHHITLNQEGIPFKLF